MERPCAGPAQALVEVCEQGTDGTDWQPIAGTVHCASCRKRNDDFQAISLPMDGRHPGIAAGTSTLLCGYRRPGVSELKERLPAIAQPALTPRSRDPENPVFYGSNSKVNPASRGRKSMRRAD